MMVKAVMVVEAVPGHNTPIHGASRIPALEHVANRPIVHHVLDGLVAANVRNVIIAGDGDALIDVRACIREYDRTFDSVDYAVCRDAVDFGSALTAVAPLVGDAACLIQPADGLIDEPMHSLAERIEHDGADLI